MGGSECGAPIPGPFCGAPCGGPYGPGAFIFGPPGNGAFIPCELPGLGGWFPMGPEEGGP